MLKKLSVFFICTFLLTGCSSSESKEEVESQTDINFEGEESVERHYEFVLGVENYNFEEWTYTGESLKFNYFIDNIGNPITLGVMFLVDGVPQNFTVNNEEKIMEVVTANTEEKVILEITLDPQVIQNETKVNISPITILNPHKVVTSTADYSAFEHSLSRSSNIILNVSNPKDLIQTPQSVDIQYSDISQEVLEEHIFDGQSSLLMNTYIDIKNTLNENGTINSENINIEAYGAPGAYNAILFEDNEATQIVSVNIEEHKYSKFTLKQPNEETKNIYVVLVPKDIRSFETDIYTIQSGRYIVE